MFVACSLAWQKHTVLTSPDWTEFYGQVTIGDGDGPVVKFEAVPFSVDDEVEWVEWYEVDD